jgi:hypothetical protein
VQRLRAVNTSLLVAAVGHLLAGVAPAEYGSNGCFQSTAVARPGNSCRLTLNADQHPLMNRMHKPDPKRPPHMQDKRSVMPIAFENVDSWLFGTVEEASTLRQLPSVEMMKAAPAQ